VRRLSLLCCVLVALAACSSGSTPTASRSGSAPSSTPPSSPASSALVGRWQRVTTCQELVTDLEGAGLKALTPFAWLGQTSSRNDSSFLPGSPTPTLARPCVGAISRVHSHFFTSAGAFGSLDWLGGQVDDDHYQVVNDHEVRIGDVTFRYSLASGGKHLTLAPELTSGMITKALADPTQFSSAGWAVSVAYPGSTWMRVDCQQWC